MVELVQRPVGDRRDHGAEHRIGRQVAVDRLGVRVQVEQAPAALHRSGQVAQVLELELAFDVTRIPVSRAPGGGWHEGA